ncbi:FAD/NAD(P)-binding protein [Magnetovibrio blakemorei]|uniref:Ni/Fe hydrogenase subunit gamma n=1 Tax=Magnetovibrio blakemorei TaxID=28181 RepID=A0A1E5Q4E8_9PROT|nr:FAD/NAD(P)-binding protein [Magnetovibrio blakemorei]OEJ65059.1 Ni/Fe hydrogenase subunit gamma [Magnetovibrio blakemorei]
MIASSKSESDTTTLDAMTPVPFTITKRTQDLADTFTIELEPENRSEGFVFQPGQFNMLYAFGVGEVPISISGDPAKPHKLIHTIRDVGAVTHAISNLKKGNMLGVRGPFGSAWPVEEAIGHDVVIVAGGIGLAPLRPAIDAILANRTQYGRFVILYGARSPSDVLYMKQLQTWRGRLDTYVDVTVDHAGHDWAGNVGVVTRLIGRANFDPHHTKVLICGPEIMMRFTIQELTAQSVDKDDIYVSMERNMKCAIGHCGHCQFGGHFVCKDGPVFPYGRIESLLQVRGL